MYQSLLILSMKSQARVKTHNPAMHFMHCVTMGDLAYLANMYYADLYPESIQTEKRMY